MAALLPDTDSEDEMPSGWEERATIDGRVYYANHEAKTTQWMHPTTGRQKRVVGDLPYGWERKVTEDGTVVFVDHNSQSTTYTDPRIAFAVEEKDSSLDIRQRFDGSSTALEILHGRDLTGKIAVVTGANCGIGFETAKSLAFHGATVILACRDLTKAEQAMTSIHDHRPRADVEAMQLDLASLKQVKQFANTFKLKYRSLHMLILNAGIFGLPFTLTVDGYEETFQVNHLGHFYLTQLLEPVLVETDGSRVVVVSSESHRFSDLDNGNITRETLSPVPSNYSPMVAYNNSKLCNVIFAKALDSRLKGKGVRCNSLHPGNMVSTQLPRQWWVYRIVFAIVRIFTKSLQQAASTTVYCATHPDLDDVGGLYFNNCCQCLIKDVAEEPLFSDKLWQICEDMIESAINSK